MQSKHERQAMVCDFLLKMNAEQSSFLRHYETQRSTATAILTSISVALLGLTGALWTHYEILDERSLPVTVTILLVAVAGYILTYKLFERSRVHHALAEAYLNTLNMVMADDVATCVGANVGSIAYVANARRDFVEAKTRRKLFEVIFPAGKKQMVNLSIDAFAERIALHNPVDPREIAIPVHNVVMGRIVRLETWRLWLWLYRLIFAVGLGFTGLGLYGFAS
ncbi:MAG: hypothetical protein QOI38_1839 [Sphingomonadales bacterium]|nr:hypothetical protein [Sphingomonadales bacterium]